MTTPNDESAVDVALSAVDSVRTYYDEHGIFLRKFGFGQRPALVVIDMAYGWTDPAYATDVIEYLKGLEVTGDPDA